MLKQESQSILLTLGHSTHFLEAFIDLLKAHSVTRLIDGYTVPRSRHNPQFNDVTFSVALESSAGIHYTHSIGLGAGLAKRCVSRLRRLHADPGICRKSGGPYRAGKARVCRIDVRRGRNRGANIAR